ncbi:MAG: serine hydrolase [Microcoleaceae cyanobacterium]
MLSDLNLHLRKVKRFLYRNLATQTRKPAPKRYRVSRPRTQKFARFVFDRLSLVQFRAQHSFPRLRFKQLKFKQLKFKQLKFKRIFLVGAMALTAGWAIASLIGAVLPDRQQAKETNFIPPLSNSEPETVSGFGYNVRRQPDWADSETLQTIVNGAVDLAKQQGLPTSKLSITLVDVSQPKAHTYAGHNNKVLRYPASVAKLFWLVEFMAAIESGEVSDESAFYVDLSNMMRISDNDSASRVVDAITDTESGDPLEGKALETWVSKRSQINQFFQTAGYDEIRLSTKNYPTARLGPTPTGRDLQLWKESDESGGNQMTTDQAARLLYEIYTKQAISPLASTKMAYLLTRSLKPEAWQNNELNSVEGFLGESLPPELYFGSKVGYTSRSRQEVALIKTVNHQTTYILAVFGTDPTYAENEEIFPQMSRYVFERLSGAVPIDPPQTQPKRRN